MPILAELPACLQAAWHALGDSRKLIGALETSPGVSTNRVFRLDLDDGSHLFAKTSSYGSYVHFRQDHLLVMGWHNALAETRFANLLARPLCKDGEVFTFRDRGQWAVFYEQAPHLGVLPRRLPMFMVERLGRETAELHLETSQRARHVNANWAGAGADIATLFDRMTRDEWHSNYELTEAQRDLVAYHCERFLGEATRLGFHQMQKMPVLVDWNRGNFSVRHTEDGPELFSRWDYDWFRIEPRTFDFYFFSRVVREEGDQTEFSYGVSPMLEPRFVRFLQHYHRIFPLEPEELLFMRETYRFFLLVYVLLKGEHFFVPHLHERLRREALEGALQQIDATDFTVLVDEVLG